MNFLDDKNNKDKFGIFLFCIALIFLLITSIIGFTKIGLWFDEIFSMGMAQLPFNDMLGLGMMDVHPLLYYLMYKSLFKFFSFLGIANLGYNSVAYVGRFLSLLPIYLLGILSVTKIREKFGLLTSGLFFLCICSMPQLMIYSIEIRMYSWALFFITASFIYFLEIIDNSSFKSWLILSVLTLCSAYTHYFAAVASFSIYLVLLIHILKNNKKQLKNWLISTVAVVLCYLPWIFTVIDQVSRISGSYWISEITFDSIITYVYYVLSPSNVFIASNEMLSPTVLGTIFLLLFVYLFYKNRDRYADYSMIVFLCVPVIGIIISLLIRPFFHPRYLIPSLGCLWLGFSILVSKQFNNKKLFILIIAFVLLVGVVGTYNFVNIENTDSQVTSSVYNSLATSIGSGNVIFVDFFATYLDITNYYLPDNHVLSFSGNVSNQTLFALNDNQIKAEIEHGSHVYYIDGGKENITEFNNTDLDLREIKFNYSDKVEFKVYEIMV